MCVYLKECANIWEFPNGSEFLGRCLLKKKINLHLYFSSVGRQLFFSLFIKLISHVIQTENDKDIFQLYKNSCVHCS